MAETPSNSSQTGYGQQDPSTGTADFNAISFVVRQMLARMDTMKLVEVVKVTAGTGDGVVKKAGTVDVKPLVSQIDGNGNPVPHGTVHGIPWARQQGGKNAVVVDPEVGDIGYVIASDRDISVVKKTGKAGNPGSRRLYSIADGVYVGGVLAVAPEQYLVFTADGCRLVTKDAGSIVFSKDDGVKLVDKTGNEVTMTAEGITLKPSGALPVKVQGNLIVTGNLQLGGVIKSEVGGAFAGTIETTGLVKGGTVEGTSDVTAAGKSLAGHIHNGVVPGGGNSGPNQ